MLLKTEKAQIKKTLYEDNISKPEKTQTKDVKLTGPWSGWRLEIAAGFL